LALYLREEDVEQLLRPAEVTDALEAIFREQAPQQPRQRVNSGPYVLHQLEAISPALGFASSKVYLSGPAGVRFLTLLFQLEDCSLAAVIESARLGQLRTGCATALAARYLARKPVRKLAVLGTGTVARGQLEALRAEVTPEEVTFWSRKPESRADFAAWAGDVTECASAEEAVDGADLVVVATSSARPVLHGAWLGSEGLLCGVGVNWATRREMDDEAVRKCSLWVVDSLEQARLEAGDLLQTPGFDLDSCRELAEVLSNPPRHPWTGFKSLGVGREDLAAAALLYKRAIHSRLGERI
jgi:ornithine cyclodeaminase/alanine dehydrogenase-like protein (mu-crystallin family)